MKQATYIGKLMIQICADAKILTLAAFNWPARFVANEASNAFQFNQPEQNVIPENLSLQYINPKKHDDLLKSIVDGDIFEKQNYGLSSIVATNRRFDQSIYVVGKLNTQIGEMELIFLGMQQQTERDAIELFHATLSAMINMFTKDFVYDCILPKVSSIGTDGVNTNTGERGSLWFYLEREISQVK